MYDKSMNVVEDITALTDKELMQEIFWWDKNLRRIPREQIAGCTPAPNAPEFLDNKPEYYRCAPRIYWASLKEAKVRSIL